MSVLWFVICSKIWILEKKFPLRSVLRGQRWESARNNQFALCLVQYVQIDVGRPYE